MSDSVLYEQTGGVVTLTLNEPETLNAVSDGIIAGLVDAATRINADLSVGCVIVTGAGRAFSSGGNVKQMRDRQGLFAGNPAQIRRAYLHGIQRIPLALYDIEAPTIAAVNGHAVGAGCDISLMCDIRIASDAAVFAESFLRVGLVSGDGGAWFLPRIVGMSRACEMTFTGDFIDAATAAGYGLVSRVVAPEVLMDEVMALASRIAAQPPHSLRMTKRLMRESQRVELDTALELASAMQAIVQHTDDQQEAVNALLEKRPPRFDGR
ncbi:MAG: crotonase/enoyl-CoA hydratase family protein [Rhodobacteraceae bacterium]|nr:crotonase/enoyl-CoA hydratase family protein [Paracoccaceae bacterium]